MFILLCKVGNALFDIDWDGRCCDVVFGDADLDEAGLGVDGLLLVEDEVADAIIDVVPAIALDGLQGVGVMTDEGVGTGIDQSVGLQSLTGHGVLGMLATPVQ